MKIQRLIAFGLLAIGLLMLNSVPALAFNGPTLKWELVNPFRFIRDQASIDELRRVYDGLKGKKTAAILERVLQDEDENRVTEMRKQKELECTTKQNLEEKKTCMEDARVPYLGWFARLARNNYDKTCWDSEIHGFRTSVATETMSSCSDYVNPKSHMIRVWVSDPGTVSTQSIQWFWDGQALKTFKNCDAEYKRTNCIEFEVPFDESKSIEVSAKSSDWSFSPVSGPIQIKDKLIVGLGDSFAAGEGNPDIPAQFTKGDTEPDRFFKKWRWIDSPSKDKDTRVSWLDDTCHRSMYSYQFKTALQIALANPQEAVTYISFACSGAKTKNIWGEKQKGVEKQLVALRDVLTRDEGRGTLTTDKMRQIDYLLLSTGGNDIGFTEIVANIVLSASLKQAYKWFATPRIAKKLLSRKSGVIEEALMDPKKGNYIILNQKLMDSKSGIRLKGKTSKDQRSRILLTAYPNVLTDEDGTPCAANRLEFDNPFGKDENRGERLRNANEFVFIPLQATQARVETETEVGWTLVKDHVTKFEKHGFCAKKDAEVNRTGEEFVMPRLTGFIWCPFKPWEYRTYESRQRWMRLPVDAKLSVDQRSGKGIDFAFEDDRSTIMHPTAEGLAETADANVTAINKLDPRQIVQNP